MNSNNTQAFVEGKTVLVTGGAGFIGCALAKRLAAHASRYVVVDNLHPQVHASSERPSDLHQAAELIVGDVTLASTWDSLLTHCSPDIVIHLAAETGTGQSLTEGTRHSMVNVVGTSQMTDALGRHGHTPSHILLTSSRAVYGEGAWKSATGDVFYPGQRDRSQLEAAQWDYPDGTSLPARADVTIPAPSSIYGATKLTQEHILSAWANAQKVALTILRLQNVYGPGQSLTNSYTGIVALFSRLARAGQSIPLYEDGNVTRDFVFIDDVADAIVAALATATSAKRVLDVGSGTAATIRQMAELVACYYSAPSPHVCGKFRDGDVRHAACDIDRTISQLPWQPKWNLEAGVAALQQYIASINA
ncbi:NAD-dependent epimerase/dehydratase family protein [Chitinimonas koreensis]|uniref:NAD-dependent epimerase/dehydratase family protein n=1 Tax=Chitinimonas koreensis TaxID=356302 RepID=UPI00040086E4|nr:NAD-dependent epimerase/dehydratase family protein [Chitinimonas koreensis]QNM96969.1 NAD-dependent epimerase/dehydratase family protein [Chitinimonas koreensis]